MPDPSPLPSSVAASGEGLVTVELFAGMAEIAGCRRLAIPWSGGDVGALRRALGERYPALVPLLARSAIAAADRYATDDERLEPGAAVAVIPPVSGG